MTFDKIAKVRHEVVAHPVFHHVAPAVHHAPLVHHAAPVAVAHHAVDPVALTHGAVHQVTPFVDFGRKKREADAEVIFAAFKDKTFNSER